MKKGILILLIVVAVLVLGWIGRPGSSDEDPSPGPSSESVAVPRPQSSSATPQPKVSAAAAASAAEHDHDQGEAEGGYDRPEDSAPAQAVWDEPATSSASAAAARAVAAYGRTDLDQDTWWSGLDPLMTRNAASIYNSVDVRLVPRADVVGVPEVAPSASPLLANATVSTTGGSYTVLLTRLDGGAPWLVEQIRPEEEQ